MKPKKMLFVAASVALLGLVSSVSGEPTPKLQDLLNQKQPAASTASPTVVASVSYQPTDQDGIAAPPKVRELLNQQKSVRSTPSGEVVIVAYNDQKGSTAPPKVREKLNERDSTFMVAPLVTPQR